MNYLVSLSKADVENSLKEIQSLTSTARKYYEEGLNWEKGVFNDPHAMAEAYLEEAFIRTLIFLEVLGLTKAHDRMEVLLKEAKNDLLKSAMGIDEPYLVYEAELEMYLDGIATAYNVAAPRGIIANDIVSILRACTYVITDTALFPAPPANERDVHLRIEGILKTYFTDLKHAPTLTKPIKNFIPDTALPSIKTLIEYKFISNDAQAKTVADEVLADTRGYVSREWKEFIYAVYETARIRPENEWQELLKACEVDENTRIIVLAGVPAN